mmetsp:Transcript_16358/g.28702  ORF Transcript_16358/g.28702 Transcript_16358/m.28702 type:complete len:155 (-) Transcript_16358:1395-1859(-)
MDRDSPRPGAGPGREISPSIVEETGRKDLVQWGFLSLTRTPGLQRHAPTGAAGLRVHGSLGAALGMGHFRSLSSAATPAGTRSGGVGLPKEAKAVLQVALVAGDTALAVLVGGLMTTSHRLLLNPIPGAAGSRIGAATFTRFGTGTLIQSSTNC